MINAKETLGQILKEYPEVAPVLAKAGLHCIGCHVSEYESLEDGCKAHGLTEQDICELVSEANKKIKEFDNMPQVSLSNKAKKEIDKKKSKTKDKYVRIMPVFDGYDFETTNEIETDDVVLDEKIGLISDKRTQRFLKGVTVDYDDKEKDFTAKRN